MRTVSGQDLSGRLEQRTVVALGISARRGAGVGIGIDLGPGSLAPIAGIIDVTQEMAARSRQGDEAVEAVVARAQAMTAQMPPRHAAPVAPADITTLMRSP